MTAPARLVPAERLFSLGRKGRRKEQFRRQTGRRRRGIAKNLPCRSLQRPQSPSTDYCQYKYYVLYKKERGYFRVELVMLQNNSRREGKDALLSTCNLDAEHLSGPGIGRGIVTLVVT